MSSKSIWEKDSNSILDYTFDWSDWMTEGDAISSFEIIVSPVNHSNQLVVEQSSFVGNVVTVWLSQGRINTKYKVTCRIITTGGRKEDNSKIVKIVNK